MKIKGLRLLGLAVLLGALAGLPASAQQAPDNGGNGGGGGGGDGGGRGGRGGGGGNFDPAAMRQRWTDQLKTDLGVTDEEFKVLQPKIEKVRTLQRETGQQRGMGMGGRGGPNAPAVDATTLPPVARALAELKTVLDNKEATPEQIKEKLTALREAKAKAKENLLAAQKELTELLTARQEAVLVQNGTLE